MAKRKNKKKVTEEITKEFIEEIKVKPSKRKQGVEEVIKVKYNPYTYELEILESSIPLNKESDIFRKKKENNNKAFHIWYKKFIESIKETFNSKSFKIIFNGRREDFLDLKEQIDYLNENKGWKVDYELEERKGNENIISDLDNYVKKISTDAPKELKEEIKEHKAIEEFEKAKDNDVEVSVIATMSSGKSTLLNAILGSNILPSKNEACTATICNIRDNKERDKFIARAETLDGKEIAPWEEAEAEKIKEFNQRGNEEGINIFVEGNIKGIKDGEMNLVLIDTPGPNNSQNMDHKEATYKFIKDTKNNPLVLYVMNITQQAVNDDAKLLGEISEIIKNNGKQAEERFIFALNKIDCFDPEEESIDELIDNCIKYLKGFGIENPKIFPVSAEFAKVIRLNETNKKLTRAQKIILDSSERAFLPDEEDGYEGIDTIKYASISDAEKQKLYEEGKNDKLKAMLNYSGISAIELYVDKYVNKYAKTQKVKDSILTLKKVVDAANSRIETLSGKTSEELEKITAQIEEIEKILQTSGKEKIKEVEEKVKKLAPNRSRYDRLYDQLEKTYVDIEELFGAEKETEAKARFLIESTNKKLENLFISITTTAKQITGEELELKAMEIVEELRKYFANIVGNIKLDSNVKDLMEKEFELQIPSTAKLLDSGSYTVNEFVGEEYKGERSISKWWNPFSWGRTESIYENVYEDRAYVDLDKLSKIYLEPQKENIRGAINECQSKMLKRVEDLKRNAQKELEKVKDDIDKKMQGYKKEISKQKEKEQEKDKYEKQINMIKGYKDELDNILQISGGKK